MSSSSLGKYPPALSRCVSRAIEWSLLNHGVLHGLQRDLCSSAWSNSFPPSSFTLETCGAASLSSSWLSSSILLFLPWSSPGHSHLGSGSHPFPMVGPLGPAQGSPGLTPQRSPAALGTHIHTSVFQILWSCCKWWIIAQESYSWYTKLKISYLYMGIK